MRYFPALIVFCLSCLLTSGEELPPELEKLKESRENKVKIGGIGADTIRDEDDQKIEVIKFYSSQYEDDDLPYRVRVTVELTDKQGGVYYAQIQLGQGPLHDEYIGEDVWEFRVPHGDLEKPKMTAYAIQYGFFADGVFVPVAEEFSKVDSVDEITGRAQAGRLDIQCTKHTYRYRDGDSIEESQSNHESLK